MEIFRVTCHGENAWVPVGHTICEMTQRCYRQEDYKAAHLFEMRQEANRGSPGAARSAPRTAARPLPPCPRVSGTHSPSLSSSLSSLPAAQPAGWLTHRHSPGQAFHTAPTHVPWLDSHVASFGFVVEISVWYLRESVSPTNDSKDLGVTDVF